MDITHLPEQDQASFYARGLSNAELASHLEHIARQPLQMDRTAQNAIMAEAVRRLSSS